jgi:hypothetical protein
LCGINIGKGFIDEVPVVKEGRNYCHVCAGRPPRQRRNLARQLKRYPLKQPLEQPVVTTIVFNTRPLIADRAAFNRLPQEHKDHILKGPSAFEQMFTCEDFLAALRKVSKRR